MPCVALLSTDNLEDFFVYDDMLAEPLAEHGWQTQTISWQADNVNWADYALVIVRSTWDYQQQPERFMQKLEEINQQTRLENPLALMQWNLDKRYLQTLQADGVPVIPTLWMEQFQPRTLLQAFDEFAVDTLIIKPTVSANADDTYRLTKESLSAYESRLQNTFSQRPHMIQPFVNAIVEEGEYSLFYFADQLSHSILKTPAKDDFRVQEEHGGQLQSMKADERMQYIAQQALAALPEPALYARIDMVRHAGDWAIMEVELIEPSLYFNLDSKAPRRFVEAMLGYLER